MVLEIWSAPDRIFLLSRAIFSPFTPLTAWKMKISKKKMKKNHLGDIIILHKCTKNHNHMLYSSWNMPCDKCNCHFSFWAIFLIFYHPLPCPPPPTAPKTKSSTKMKKPLEISSFYTSVPKIMIRCYTGPEIWYVTDVVTLHFGLFFALLPQ